MRKATADFDLWCEPIIAGGNVVECFRVKGGLNDPSRTVLLLPGYACTGASFARQKALAADWDLRCLTLPETAASHDGLVRTLAGWVTAAAAVFDRPALLATSFSGLVAIEAVSRAPNLFSALILVSTFARSPVTGIRRAIVRALVPLGDIFSALSGRTGASLAGGPRLDTTASAELHREARCFSARQRRTRFRAALDADLRSAAARITPPALVVHGTEDRLVPSWSGRELACILPNSELCEIEGAGHLVYLTHVEPFNRAVDTFLRRALGAGAQSSRALIVQL